MKVLITINGSPLNTPNAKEAVEMAFAFASLDQEVALLIRGPGVNLLRAGQQPEQLQSQDYLALLKAIELYDIDTLYVLAADMQQYGVTEDVISLPITPLSRDELSAFHHTFDQVISL